MRERISLDVSDMAVVGLMDYRPEAQFFITIGDHDGINPLVQLLFSTDQIREFARLLKETDDALPANT